MEIPADTHSSKTLFTCPFLYESGNASKAPGVVENADLGAAA